MTQREEKLTEAQQQAQAALDKVMKYRFSNFDAGAVIHWAERGLYQVKTNPAPQPEATEGGAHEKGIEAAARAMCEAWHYAKIGTPDGDAEWKRKQDQYRKQATAAIAAYRAALAGGSDAV